MKNHHHNGPIHPTSRETIHEAIAAKAHELWVQRGKPEGRADDLWLEAERELVTGKKILPADPVLPVAF